MRRRFIPLFLAFSLLCSLLPQLGLTAYAEVYSGNCGAEGDGSNLQWSFDDATGTLTITGSGAMRDFECEADVPWIEFWAKIHTIIMPEGMMNIGSMAFASCEDLISVTIPAKV